MSNVVDFDVSSKKTAKPASGDECMAREAMQIAANLPAEETEALMTLALAACFVRLLHYHAT